MGKGIFGWVRAAAKAAFLNGIQDGLDELHITDYSVDPVTLRLAAAPLVIEAEEVADVPRKARGRG